MEPYDSRSNTITHIASVQYQLGQIIEDLLNRRDAHDASKLQEPEKSGYDQWTPKLGAVAYGSEEYQAALVAMKPFLDHHYQNNDHHPEHFELGINGMNLLQLLEMLADWKAAAIRRGDGDMRKSFEISKVRFGVPEQLASILSNTIDYLGW